MKLSLKNTYLGFTLVIFLSFMLEFLVLIPETIIYGTNNFRQWQLGQMLRHWTITCILWGLFAYIIYLKGKKNGFNLLAVKEKPTAKNLFIVFLGISFCIMVSFISWDFTFKPIAEWISKTNTFGSGGAIAFIFQYIYYLTESVLICGLTWGLGHIFSQNLATGIQLWFITVFYGVAYILLKKKAKYTYVHVMRKPFSVVITQLLLVLTFTGCGKADAVSEPLDVSTAVPEAYMVTGDNYFDYQPGLECAAFSSAYILRHYGEEADGLALYENFPCRLPEGGVMPNGIEEFFNGRGYKAEFKSDGTVAALKELVSRGAPVIVFIHVEEPYETTHNTHYIPLIGYDAEYFYFVESLTEYSNCRDEKDVPYNRKIEIAKFERLWANIDGAWDYPYFVITK